jgi:hypothetical protein
MITLNNRQIKAAVSQAETEIDREIYSIAITDKEIIINGDWSIKRDKNSMMQNIIAAIEEYCTRANIEWEYNSSYSAYCD